MSTISRANVYTYRALTYEISIDAYIITYGTRPPNKKACSFCGEYYSSILVQIVMVGNLLVGLVF